MIKTEMGGRVARRKDERQFVPSEMDGTRLGKKSFANGRRAVVPYSHLGGIVLYLHKQGQFALVKQGEQPVLFVNIAVAEHVIHMAMGIEQQRWLEPLRFDERPYGFFFSRSVHPRIDDCRRTVIIVQ